MPSVCHAAASSRMAISSAPVRSARNSRVSPADVPSDQLGGAAPPPRRKQRRCCSGNCCLSLTLFLIIVLVVIPILVFFCAALFTVPLWLIECEELKDDPDVDSDKICSYHEWFLYLIGNIVGLGTPLTDVTVDSGHIFGEIVDIYTAVAALSVAGTAIGIIGALATVHMVVSGTEQGMRKGLKWLTTMRVRRMARDPTGMSCEEWLRVAGSMAINMSEEDLTKLFHEADTDRSGTLDRTEAETLLQGLQEDPYHHPLKQSMQLEELQQSMGQLTAAMRELSAKVDDALTKLHHHQA